MFWNAKDGQIEIEDTVMEYISFGYGKESLIIIPGLSEGLTTLKGKALMLAAPYRMFSKKYTVYMFARRTVMPEGFTIRDMAGDITVAMEKLGIEKADVVGVSQGGMIAQYLAIDHPEMVNRLVLAVTAPNANDTIQSFVESQLKYAEQGDHKKIMISAGEAAYTKKRLKYYRLLYPVIEHIGKPKNYDRYIANARAIAGFDARDELNKIICPTMIMGGSDDLTVGVQGSYDLHDMIPQSKIHIFQGYGHAAFDEAKNFNKVLWRFLN